MEGMTEENRALGTPLGKHPTRVLFLGSGELGKEVTLELMRLGAWVCAADSYEGAPAQQVAHEYRALDMANAEQLRVLFDEIQPDIIVPEVEAIATSELAAAAERGAQVVPSAEIASICMDRERLRVLAHENWDCRPRRTASQARWKSFALGQKRLATRAWSSRL